VQDTGGFFVCSIRRVAPCLTDGIARPIGLGKPSRGARKKQKQPGGTALTPGYETLADDRSGKEILRSLTAFYGLSKSFPSQRISRLATGNNVASLAVALDIDALGYGGGCLVEAGLRRGGWLLAGGALLLLSEGTQRALRAPLKVTASPVSPVCLWPVQPVDLGVFMGYWLAVQLV
jgi:hypothetical protein